MGQLELQSQGGFIVPRASLPSLEVFLNLTKIPPNLSFNLGRPKFYFFIFYNTKKPSLSLFTPHKFYLSLHTHPRSSPSVFTSPLSTTTGASSDIFDALHLRYLYLMILEFLSLSSHKVSHNKQFGPALVILIQPSSLHLRFNRDDSTSEIIAKAFDEIHCNVFKSLSLHLKCCSLFCRFARTQWDIGLHEVDYL